MPCLPCIRPNVGAQAMNFGIIAITNMLIIFIINPILITRSVIIVIVIKFTSNIMVMCMSSSFFMVMIIQTVAI